MIHLLYIQPLYVSQSYTTGIAASKDYATRTGCENKRAGM